MTIEAKRFDVEAEIFTLAIRNPRADLGKHRTVAFRSELDYRLTSSKVITESNISFTLIIGGNAACKIIIFNNDSTSNCSFTTRVNSQRFCVTGLHTEYSFGWIADFGVDAGRTIIFDQET